MKKLILFSLLIALSSQLFAQGGVGINTDNTNPHNSAMLDIKSTTKGVLLPRLTEIQKNSLVNPAIGLLVFQTDGSIGLNFYNGTAWQEVGANNNLSGFTSIAGLTSAINNTDNFIFGANNLNYTSGTENKVTFFQNKGAFRAGGIDSYVWDITNVGDYSFASGYNTKASDNYSTAMGQNTLASALHSTAFGLSTTASGLSSTAIGQQTIASGDISIAMGSNTIASGLYATSMGSSTTASGIKSIAMGERTTASGKASTTMGSNTKSYGDYSTALGYNSTASQNYSTAMGNSTTASGESSVSMGKGTIAASFAETTIGSYNTIYLPQSLLGPLPYDRLFVIGNGTSNTSRSDALVIRKDGVTFFSTTDEKALLNIGSPSNSYSIGSYFYLNSTSPSINFDNGGVPKSYSIYAADRIAGLYVMSYSDARIKDIEGRSDRVEDLQTLAQIRITDYSFKDKIKNGDEMQKKVIAQELKAIYPQAVDATQTEIVPDIMLATSINEGWILLEDSSIVKGTKLRIIFESGMEELLVQDIKKGAIKVNSDQKGKAFVYGREVHDFHQVDYDALTTLNISATQELIHRITMLEKENTILKAKNNEFDQLKAEVQQIKFLLSGTSSLEKE